MIRALLTPAQFFAWQTLAQIPPADLLNRPLSALAAKMQIPPRSARYHLQALCAVKLAERLGTQGICLVVPGPGSSHFVAVDTITRDNRRGRKLPGCRQGGRMKVARDNLHPPLAARLLAGDEISGSLLPVCFCSSSLEEDQRRAKTARARKEDPAAALALKIRKVQTLARQGASGRKARPENTAEGQLFVQMYEERRRKVDPGYEATGPEISKLLTVLKAFDQHKIRRPLWGCYLDMVFEGHARVTNGRCIFPMPANVRSRHWIGEFVTRLGVRQRDGEEVRKRLVQAGFEVTLAGAAIAMYFADRLAQHKAMPPDLETQNAPLWAQVVFLESIIDDLGYDDDPDAFDDDAKEDRNGARR